MSGSEVLTLFFEPLDLLLFRDHRPFDMGLNVMARSRFPLPSVFHGALRTTLIRATDPDFFLGSPTEDEVNELIDQEWGLELQGPLVARISRDDRLEAFYPIPLDSYLADPGHDSAQPVLWRMRKIEEPAVEGIEHVLADAFTKLILFQDRPRSKSAGARLLTKVGLEWWQSSSYGDSCDTDGATVQQHELFEEEARIGIARDQETLTASEGMFYITVKLRFATRAGLAVQASVKSDAVDDFKRTLDDRMVMLGGKGHRARVRVFDGALLLPDSPRPAKDTRLLLLTPAPASVSWPNQVAMATSRKALPAGGYDMAKRAPRPLTPLLPGGTVLIRAEEEAQASPLEIAPPWARAGYGMYTTGE